VRTWFYL